MLRRDFLKLLSLIPICGIKVSEPPGLSEPLYAIVQLDSPFKTIYPENNQFFGLCIKLEVELAHNNVPEIGQSAYLRDNGTVGIPPVCLDKNGKPYKSNIFNHLGIFLTKAYRKEESKNNHIRMEPIS